MKRRYTHIVLIKTANTTKRCYVSIQETTQESEIIHIAVKEYFGRDASFVNDSENAGVIKTKSGEQHVSYRVFSKRYKAMSFYE